jgi:hypothetical protein
MFIAEPQIELETTLLTPDGFVAPPQGGSYLPLTGGGAARNLYFISLRLT